MDKPVNKLRVVHFPQVGSLKKAFIFEVKDESHAYAVEQALALQHLWLFKNKVIPDYSNAIIVEIWDDTIDDETSEPYGWCDYMTEDGDDWDSYVKEHFKTESNVNT